MLVIDGLVPRRRRLSATVILLTSRSIHIAVQLLYKARSRKVSMSATRWDFIGLVRAITTHFAGILLLQKNVRDDNSYLTGIAEIMSSLRVNTAADGIDCNRTFDGMEVTDESHSNVRYAIVVRHLSNCFGISTMYCKFSSYALISRDKTYVIQFEF